MKLLLLVFLSSLMNLYSFTTSHNGINSRSLCLAQSILDLKATMNSETITTTTTTTTPITTTIDSNTPPQMLETDKIFVGNLPFTITEEIVREIIIKEMGVGVIKNINLMKGKKTKRSFGFLFIDFVNPKTAAKAAEILDGYDLDGRILNCNLKYPDDGTIIKAATSNVEKIKKTPLTSLTLGNTIYLSNMDYSLGEEEIYNMCDDLMGVGLVKEVRIPLDRETGSPRGFAYIEFKEGSSVDIAMNELSEVEVYGRLLKVERMSMPGKKVVAKTTEDEEEEILGSLAY